MKALKTGSLVTLPGLLGRSCHLSADDFGVSHVWVIPSYLVIFPLEILSWAWEFDEEFDKAITREQSGPNAIQWVDSRGKPIVVGNEMTARGLEHKITRVERGEVIGNVHKLSFRDPNHFRVGELHAHYLFWESVAERCPEMATQTDVLNWIKHKVSIFRFFQHFKGSCKSEHYDSDRPPHKMFKNNMSCKHFVSFVQKTLINRRGTGAVSLVGRVGEVAPPHIILPLTVEPIKPGLCHDVRYLNLWMRDNPFSLDTLNDLPSYVG